MARSLEPSRGCSKIQRIGRYLELLADLEKLPRMFPQRRGAEHRRFRGAPRGPALVRAVRGRSRQCPFEADRLDQAVEENPTAVNTTEAAPLLAALTRSSLTGTSRAAQRSGVRPRPPTLGGSAASLEPAPRSTTRRCGAAAASPMAGATRAAPGADMPAWSVSHPQVLRRHLEHAGAMRLSMAQTDVVAGSLHHAHLSALTVPAPRRPHLSEDAKEPGAASPVRGGAGLSRRVAGRHPQEPASAVLL